MGESLGGQRSEGLLSSAFDTHDVFNQSPPFAGINLFTSDPGLGALVEGLPQSVVGQLVGHGATWGSPETFELGRIANQSSPVLKTHDPSGVRIDMVEFHPAYHALMRRSISAGLHCSLWDASGGEANVRTVARAARLFMTAQAECGHICPMTMTNASIAALAHAPALANQWLPLIRTRQYDSSAQGAVRESRADARHGHDGEAGRQRSQRHDDARQRRARRHVADHGTQMVHVGADERRVPGPDAYE